LAKDYYNTLGISKEATTDQIKAAYKKLAKKYHPDVSKEEGTEKKFKEVLEAYNTLRDPQKRANYDRFGDAAQRFGGFGDFSGAGFQRYDFDFGDIFSDFGFGGGMGDLFRGAFGGRRKRGPQRGESIRFDLGVKFEEAAFGTEKEFTIDRMEECNKCKGSGAEGSSGKVKCNVCHGTGMEEKARRMLGATFVSRSTCSKCHGEGEIIEKPCKKCGGAGRIKQKRKIKVKIPAGVNTGNHLRLQGQGNSGERGAGAGDLFVVLFVEPHDFFKRDGTDIFSEIPVSFSEAALGTEIEVPTLRGKAKVKVPRGTQSETIFKMRGQGIKELNSSRIGDQYVKVILKTPGKLSREQKKLFEELGKIEKTKKERKGFFDSIAKHFKGS